MEEVKICRLCLILIQNNDFEALETIRIEMLKTLSVPINPAISENPVICYPCSENLQKCFDFKMTCLNTEDCVRSFVDTQEPSKVDLEHVLFKELLKNVSKNGNEGQICRLCLNFKGKQYTKLENTMLNEILEKCLPKLDLSLTKNPLICHICLECLKDEFLFVTLCMKTEEKLNKHCGVSGKVDLRQVSLHFTEVKTEVESRGVQTNPEFATCPSEALFLKSESENDSNLESYTHTTNYTTTSFITNQKTYACKNCDFVTHDKRVLKIHNFSHGEGKKLYECPLCPFITRHRTVITNHELTHKSLDEIEWHQCQICTYRTKLKANLHNHSQIHKKPDEVKRFKCEECPYKSPWKRDLERHALKHKNPSEIVMHKCDYCVFTTKHERYLKQHTVKLHLGGTDASEGTYSCANCSFTTKFKRSLVSHMLLHKNPEDLLRFKVYRCSVCPYQAKWKESVRKHELIHKKRFECDECDFVTSLRRFLVKHKGAHRSLEETPVVYSCEHCPYQTVRKNGLRNHSLVHKTEEEVTMHQCPNCEYKTKRGQDLKQHITLIHNEDATVYSCDFCEYRTKYKHNFRQHKRLRHLNPEEIKLFKCERCDFATKYKSSLIFHDVSYHKRPEEITMLKCPTCEFQTKRRECLRSHLITHKSPEELEMFKCGDCAFQSKYKRALKKHMQGHRPGAKETVVFKCDVCEFETKWKQTLWKHKKQHEMAGEVKVLSGVKQEGEIVKNEVLIR